MTLNSQRAGITQAKHNESMAVVLGLDALITGIISYLSFGNGLVAVLIGIGMGLLLTMPVIGVAIGVLISAVYGWAGYGIAHSWFQNGSNTSIGWGAIIGMIALGAHVAGHQHFRDLHASK